LIFASTSCIALDIVTSKIIGYNPRQIIYIREAIKRGLFPDIESVEEVGAKDVRILFKHPTGFFEHLPGFLQGWVWDRLKARPILDMKGCKKCGICVKACPVNVIKMDGMPKIEEDKCILCYCCHELCPESAIVLKQNWLGYLIGKSWR
jgi:ferredoxin